VAVIVGVVVATSGGGKDNVNTAASNGVSSSTGSSSSALPAVPVGASGRGVMIDAITIKDGKYSVTYRTAGYTPKVDGNDPESHHIHFFFDNLAVENAGTNGPNPGSWILYDVPSPFEGFKESDRPSSAKRMCAVVSDFLHRIEVDTGNCVNLPGA
jgi:hypothetical protein